MKNIKFYLDAIIERGVGQIFQIIDAFETPAYTLFRECLTFTGGAESGHKTGQKSIGHSPLYMSITSLFFGVTFLEKKGKYDNSDITTKHRNR